jgi:hypothetical protein
MAANTNLTTRPSLGRKIVRRSDDCCARGHTSYRNSCTEEAFVNQCVHFNISFMCQIGFDFELKLLNGVSRRIAT